MRIRVPASYPLFTGRAKCAALPYGPAISGIRVMPMRLTIDIDDEMAAALDRMIAATKAGFPRELAAAVALRDWLIAAGYLPSDKIEDGTPTEAEAKT